MGKIFIKGIALSSFILAFFLLFSSVSCKKTTECTAIITVVDSLGIPVSGATVRLFANVNPVGVVESIQPTDLSGNSTHKIKLEAILDIEAKKDSLSGIGIIRLEPGKKVNKTVTIR